MQQVIPFLAVLIWAVAPERLTVLALRVGISVFALGLH
jgi:hypothetical protein